LFPGGFFHDSLNDLICIPFWVPIMLWLMRVGRLRDNDAPPQWYEIVLPVLVWSAVFELLLPRIGPFRHLAIADPADIVWYVLGGHPARDGGVQRPRRPPAGRSGSGAGICHARGENARVPPQWLIYIAVADVAASAARCEALGGRVLDGPRPMGSHQFCVIQD